MSTAGTKLTIPSLPPDTAGRWLDVVREDEDMVRRWLRVMWQMDDDYRRENIFLFNRNMGHRPSRYGASYYYWNGADELALRLVYCRPRGQHQVLNVGFLGTITPQRALDLLVDRAIEYLRERKATSMFALCPKQMTNRNILLLYDLVPGHPRFRVTTERESPSTKEWNIEVPELN